MKKYLKIIMAIGASAFVGFVAYATVQTNKISDDTNTIPEIAVIEETIMPYEEITIPTTKITNKNITPEPIINPVIKEGLIIEPIITQYEYEEEDNEKEETISKYYDEDDRYEEEEDDD
jgi:hypothetical protein